MKRDADYSGSWLHV